MIMKILFAADAVKGAPVINTWEKVRRMAKKPGIDVTLLTNANKSVFEDIDGIKAVYLTKKDVTGISGIIIRSIDMFVLSLKQSFDVLYTRNAFLAFLMSFYKRFIPSSIRPAVIWEINGLSMYEYKIAGKGKLACALSRIFEHFIVARLVDGCAAVNSSIVSILKSEGVSSDKLFIIPNGVDTGAYEKSFDKKEFLNSVTGNDTIGENEKICVFVGSTYPWHGLNHSLNTFSLIHDKLINDKKRKMIHFIVAGPDKKSYYSSGSDCSEKLPEMRNIHFTGWLNPETISTLISACDAGVHMGYHYYSLTPLKVLEYMGAGKPVIGSIFALPTIMKDCDGFLPVNPFDYEASAKSIINLLDDERVMSDMGKAVKEYAEKYHDWDKTVDIIINRAEDLLRLRKQEIQ